MRYRPHKSYKRHLHKSTDKIPLATLIGGIMVALTVHKHFQAIRNPPFCYICGDAFIAGEDTNYDHVPAQSAFNPRDRGPVLKLKTHKHCHDAFSVADRKFGQLIALRRREYPRSLRDQALDIETRG